MFARIALLAVLVSSTIAHAQTSAPPAAPAKPAKPTIEELAQRMAEAHAEVEGNGSFSPSHARSNAEPEERLTPGGITRSRLVLGQTLSGLGVAGLFTFSVFIAPPVTLLLLPIMPFATSGMVQAVGNAWGGRARYGLTLLGGLGGMAAGLVLGFVATMAVPSGGSSTEYEEDASFQRAIVQAALVASCTAVGTVLGSVSAYNFADRARRKRQRVKISVSAGPLDRGAFAGLRGRF